MIIGLDKYLRLADYYDVLYKEKQLDIEKDTLETIESNYQFLKDYSKDKIIYGINTGLGPMAQYKIDDEK